jgi:hypothetical protein
MRHLAILCAVVGGLFFLAAPAVADAWQLDEWLKEYPKSGWARFGVGTMIHTRTTNTTTVPGMPEPQKQVSEMKKTLVKISDAGYHIKTEMMVNGQWMPATEEVEPKHDGRQAKVTDAGTETVTIGGTPYPCAKKNVTWTGGDEEPETFTLWVHAEKGIVKMTMPGQEGAITVTKFDQSWTVGGVTLKGREVELEAQHPMAGPMKATHRISLDIPENAVRMEMSGGQGPMKFSMVTELIAFVKK